MYPQSELDNYKLQVELLQEKLQRSEENRKHLEQNLTQILQKRSEHDKFTRTKTRQKYQKFLEEQATRNERNKLLVQMLERIDEQTTIMSARSERLKMLKLQYEMYFAKLVQSQTMRCIQGIAPTAPAASASPFPVLLPEVHAAPTLVTAKPIKSNDASDSSGIGIGNGNINNMPLQTHYANQNIANIVSSNIMGNSTRLRLVAVPDWSLSDLDKMNEAYLSGVAAATNAAAITAAATAATTTPTLPATMNLASTQYAADNFDKGFAPLATTAMGVASTFTLPTQKDNEQQQQLFSTMSTITKPASSSPATLSLDKLSKTLKPTMTAPNFDVTDDDFGAGNARKPQAAAVTISLTELQHGGADRTNLENDLFEPAATVTKLLTNMTSVNSNENIAAAANVAEATPRQPKINEAGWHTPLDEQPHEAAKSLRSHPSKWEADRGRLQRQGSAISTEDDRAIGSRQINSYETDKLLNQNAPARFAGVSAAAPELTAMEAKALLPPTSAGNQSSLSRQVAVPAPEQQQLPPQPALSIENIENAIYGELVNPTLPAEHTKDIREATQSLFENLVTQPQVAELTTATHAKQQHAVDAVKDYANYASIPGDEVSYNPSAMSDYSDATSYEPTYATIEGTTEAEVYQPQQQTAETVNSEGGTPVGDSLQYGEDGVRNAVQDDTYGNYGNYDASQYDPATTYPGYTYDEATGQYIPDETTQLQYAATNEQQAAQYTTQAEAAYAEIGGYDQQQYDGSGQEVNYDYNNYSAQEAPAANAADASPQDADTAISQEVVTPSIEVAAAVATPIAEPPAAQSPKVPTSILSSAAAAANDAAQKKKKRVNFVDSSETDESSSAKLTEEGGALAAAGSSAVAGLTTGSGGGVASSESDFDFSASEVPAAAASAAQN